MLKNAVTMDADPDEKPRSAVTIDVAAPAGFWSNFLGGERGRTRAGFDTGLDEAELAFFAASPRTRVSRLAEFLEGFAVIGAVFVIWSYHALTKRGRVLR